MVYQGSKDRLAKYIVPIIQQYIDEHCVTHYIEPFVGGANMIDKIRCENKYGRDYNEYVIALLKYAQSDNSLSIAPESCSFEHYCEVRDAYKRKDYSKYSKEYISLIGYMASYGGRFFDGGYGRDAKGGRSIYSERLANLKKQSPFLNGIKFDAMSYDNSNTSEFVRSVYYCDPPYRNTKPYARQAIDYENFYNWCCELTDNGNTVFISEYDIPDSRFECIWQKERNVMQKSDREKAEKAVEKLYICRGNRLDK